MRYLLPAISFLCLLTVAEPVSADLIVHPVNPHYFQDTATGKPVIITAYGTVAPSSNTSDYRKETAALAREGMTYARVWHHLPWEDGSIWPWARDASSGKYDLDTWNPEYWSRLRGCLAAMEKAHVVAELIVFDRCGMSSGGDRWQRNPWASDNNVNGIELPPSTGSGVPGFYDYASKPNLRARQERYVKKLIDETIAYKNVIYEIENEHQSSRNPSWARHYRGFVRDYIAKQYPGRRRLIAYSSLMPDLEACYADPNIDIINKHYGGELDLMPSSANSYIESRWRLNKPINIDEFANGVKGHDLLREQCWTILASGGHFHIEDAAPSSKPYEVVRNIRSFISESKWDFIRSAPSKASVARGGGCCMSQPGVEYVCYFPKGGRKEISLAPGSYSARWWDPRAGGFTPADRFAHTEGAHRFDTPDRGDWVLQIRRLSS